MAGCICLLTVIAIWIIRNKVVRDVSNHVEEKVQEAKKELDRV